jgi:hypothetical protein
MDGGLILVLVLDDSERSRIFEVRFGLREGKKKEGFWKGLEYWTLLCFIRVIVVVATWLVGRRAFKKYTFWMRLISLCFLTFDCSEKKIYFLFQFILFILYMLMVCLRIQ